MDFFQSHKLPKPFAIFFHFPERSIALVKRLAGSPRAVDPTCYANKVLLKVAHAFLYTLTSFSRTKLCPSRCYLTFFHFPERSIALVKRLAGSQKG
jgi:hypothetical protein